MSTPAEHTSATVAAGAQPSRRKLRVFSTVNALTLIAVLLQAVWAGEFLGRRGAETWMTVHEIGGFATVVIALAAAILALILLRRSRPRLTAGAVAQFVLIIAQTGLGEAAGQGGNGSPVVAHIPLAVLIFGLGTYLAVIAAQPIGATADAQAGR